VTQKTVQSEQKVVPFLVQLDLLLQRGLFAASLNGYHCIFTCAFCNKITIEELWNYSMLPLSYKGKVVEAGSNTSTVALRVVGGDEKGTQCLGV
jgi:hypothetical protein